ncbi:hypothetical protein [Nocardia brasiliensis]
MDPNLIRPALIGIGAGIGAFAVLFIWVDYDLWDRLARWSALSQLTPAERAELDALNEQRRHADAAYRLRREEYERERAEFAAHFAAGFNPDLLSTADSVEDVRELDCAQLVAEIEHTEHAYRRGADHRLVYPHREALYEEFQRRNEYEELIKLPRVTQLRMELAREHITAIRNRAFISETATTATEESIAYSEVNGADLTGRDPEIGW